MGRTTVAQVAAQVNTLAESVAQLTAVIQGQHATPAPVAEKVVTLVPAVDPVTALVQEKGFAFAKGGRAYLTLNAATAVARVLKTGTPEIVAAADENSNKRRNVTHQVLFRTENGSVGVHPLYKKD